MGKSKSVLKYFSVSVLAMLLLMIFCLLTGCVGSLFPLQQYDDGQIGKIIYASDVSSYIEGKNIMQQGVVADFLGDDAEVSDAINEEIYIVEGDAGKADIVIHTTKGVAYGNDAAVNMYYTNQGTLSGYVAILDCSRIFSPFINGLLLGEDCSNESCTCGWDPDIGCMCTQSTPSYLYLDHPITQEEIDANVGCLACWTYELASYDENSNTYEYTPVNICSCTAKFNGEDVAYNLLYNQMVMNQYEKETVMPAFDELIVDGFDFSIIHNIIENQDLSSLVNSHLKDSSNYSYMFSGVPAKTITLKNIKGQEYIKDLSHAFENCINLEKINFGNFFDGMKPTDLSNLFFNCPNLHNIDLTGLDTSLVTDMSYMFSTYYTHGKLIEDWMNTSFEKSVLPFAYSEDLKEHYTLCDLGVFGDLDSLVQYSRLYQLDLSRGLPYTVREAYEIYYGQDFDAYVQSVMESEQMSQSEAIQTIYVAVLDFAESLNSENSWSISLISDEEYSQQVEDFVPVGTLNLTGLVIGADTDITNMFGEICNFATIQTPKQIAGGVEIDLPHHYKTGDSVQNKLSSANANSILTYTEEELTSPQQDNTLLYVVLGSIGSVIIVAVAVTVAVVIIRRKRDEKTSIDTEDNCDKNTIKEENVKDKKPKNRKTRKKNGD